MGMMDAEFTRLVRMGMERAAYRNVSTGQVEPPYPSQRIVWHVNPSGPEPVSRLVVNVFNGGRPYADEEQTISDDASRAAIVSDVESMSEQLRRDVAAQANAQKPANARA